MRKTVWNKANHSRSTRTSDWLIPSFLKVFLLKAEYIEYIYEKTSVGRRCPQKYQSGNISQAFLWIFSLEHETVGFSSNKLTFFPRETKTFIKNFVSDGKIYETFSQENVQFFSSRLKKAKKSLRFYEKLIYNSIDLCTLHCCSYCCWFTQIYIVCRKINNYRKRTWVQQIIFMESRFHCSYFVWNSIKKLLLHHLQFILRNERASILLYFQLITVKAFEPKLIEFRRALQSRVCCVGVRPLNLIWLKTSPGAWEGWNFPWFFRYSKVLLRSFRALEKGTKSLNWSQYFRY